jgi:single-strand selective monofunctional uracil DNA glycosylase
MPAVTTRGLADALLKEWKENARRWEKVAAHARTLGLLVWNPALYTTDIYEHFLSRYPPRPGAVLILGLNPGPHGMSQTGIPFTDCRTAKAKLGISLEVPGRAPEDLCRWLKKENGRWRSTYERSSLGVYRFLQLGWRNDLRVAFANVYIANPCPLLFFSSSGKNVTPADPILRRLPQIQALRQQLVRNVHALLSPRAIVCLGADAHAVMGDAARELMKEEPVLSYPHPARAVPEKWARGLLRLLAI